MLPVWAPVRPVAARESWLFECNVVNTAEISCCLNSIHFYSLFVLYVIVLDILQIFTNYNLEFLVGGFELKIELKI